jgi:hypothetical protein
LAEFVYQFAWDSEKASANRIRAAAQSNREHDLAKVVLSSLGLDSEHRTFNSLVSPVCEPPTTTMSRWWSTAGVPFRGLFCSPNLLQP